MFLQPMLHNQVHEPLSRRESKLGHSSGKTLEIMPQEESQLDWKAYSMILQCKSRPHRPSSEMNHKLSSRVTKSYKWQLEKEVFCRIQLQFGQIQIDLFSSHLNHSFAFYTGEDKLIFEEGFYNTDPPNLEISNLVSDDTNTCPSSSSPHVSLSTGTFQEVLAKQ
ncbi:hypothetical protein ACTFIW_000858 [Dictyostelium discoideum]